MHLIHTSDWHLGHHLHGVNREYEHRRFLEWLMNTIEDQRADALLIAGDVFDSANPPAAAQALYYRFLAEARHRFPSLDLVVIGGNHDSASRLDAPKPLLRHFNIHVMGSVARTPQGQLDLDQLLVPLRNGDNDVAAWCAAVPFLRPADLPRMGQTENWLERGVGQVYGEVFAALEQRRQPGQALIATGHAYMTGGELSELSERKIQVGNQHALPVAIFPERASYTALGHLHKAQRVGGRDNVRYSGSPLPLSLDEAGYLHQVLLVSLDGERCREIKPLPVPRAVDIIRIPKGRGDKTLDEVLAELRELPERGADLPPEQYPFLEVTVFLPQPEPGLRKQIEEALADKAVRLLKIRTRYPKPTSTLADTAESIDLAQLEPEEVFARKYRSQFDDEPPKAMRQAFHELLEATLMER
ncbi:Nuclease SbcCD subunit D [Sulfidibacter corallicola]|uniref:Nuclease SbcCD subunit D n=1 Tax=Sulfidibacter corallicola TaxID=2818388 RepID=A0A8A4TT60_SULCO|nr:exonuclease SbcCD subunit D C-terminal domain-containing protein [Sulfidibacter corallicola]QTD52344.1 exonuclease SbcCD subunit D C-terminal domain-containing protein [Sulfidibacter corallicola]